MLVLIIKSYRKTILYFFKTLKPKQHIIYFHRILAQVTLKSDPKKMIFILIFILALFIIVIIWITVVSANQ